LLEKQVALLRDDSEAQVKRFVDAARVTRARLAELQPAPPQP
jgi:hypothetical protein